jgi:hypothetical protein
MPATPATRYGRRPRPKPTWGSPYRLFAVDEIAHWFEGLELVEPGLVPITHWRPGQIEVGQLEHFDAYGGVARKP